MASTEWTIDPLAGRPCLPKTCCSKGSTSEDFKCTGSGQLRQNVCAFQGMGACTGKCMHLCDYMHELI